MRFAVSVLRFTPACRLVRSTRRESNCCRIWRHHFSSSAGELVTDATFRYRSFSWELSNGVIHDYEYVIAQQPRGGDTAKKEDALSALKAGLPPPASGWSVVLVPSVSLVCGGKEEMRPLASELTQRGHRCFILEWPGWVGDGDRNWALECCKPRELASEYEDFWCQILKHLAHEEAQEVQRLRNTSPEGDAVSARKLCVIGAGHSGVYVLRALSTLEKWAASGKSGCSRSTCGYDTLVMLAPTWQTKLGFLFSCVEASAMCRWLGLKLHGDESRISKRLRKRHFSKRHFRRHFPHGGVVDETEHAYRVAKWLFQRRRPLVQTDAAVLCGLLDPPGSLNTKSFASEITKQAVQLNSAVLFLLPDGGNAQKHAEFDALAESVTDKLGVSIQTLPEKSPLPHEVAPLAILEVLERWLVKMGLVA